MSQTRYGVFIEFEDPEPLLEATRAAYRAGYRKMDAYVPHSVPELPEALGMKHDLVAPFALLGGISGGVLGFGMQAYAHVVDYPINVGGRPLFSWPAFIPVTFELTVLGASLSAALAMLALNRLPRPWHPAFELRGFERASKDRFFLCILGEDVDLGNLDALMKPFRPLRIEEVKTDAP